jgi:hypothetical protein
MNPNHPYNPYKVVPHSESSIVMIIWIVTDRCDLHFQLRVVGLLRYPCSLTLGSPKQTMNPIIKQHLFHSNHHLEILSLDKVLTSPSMEEQLSFNINNVWLTQYKSITTDSCPKIDSYFRRKWGHMESVTVLKNRFLQHGRWKRRFSWFIVPPMQVGDQNRVP